MTTSSTNSYDVTVVGGGAAGVSAALGAAQAGARVLLLESAPFLGGAATLRTVSTYCGLYACSDAAPAVVTGAANQVLDGLRALGGVSRPFRAPAHGTLPALKIVSTDPESIKTVMDQLVERAGIDLLLSTSVIDVRVNEDRDCTIGAVAFGGAHVEITTSTIVDASGDASAAFLAGLPVLKAPDATRQTSTMSARFGGIDPDADVSAATLSTVVRGAQHAGDNELTSSTGFSTRLPLSGDLVAYLADEDADPLVPKNYTSATTDARRQAQDYLDVIRTLPGCDGAYLVSTGPELGVRESRHLTSRRPLHDEDLISGTIAPDTVALCGWPSEYHPGAGKPSEWTPVGGNGAFGITLDNLRSAGSSKVFGAGRVLTGDHLAGTASRVMGTSFATGQAAGVAAALVARDCDGIGLIDSVLNNLVAQGATLSV